MAVQATSKFADDIEKLYKNLEQPLVALAYRYRASRPQAVVREWMSRMYEIVDRFDKGELTPKIKIDGDLVDYDPTIHSPEQFVPELKKYLKAAFVNDLMKVHNAGKRTVSDQDKIVQDKIAMANMNSGYDDYVRPVFKYDVIKLDFLIKIIESDLKKAEESSSCALDVTHAGFVKAVLGFCNELYKNPDWHEVAVVPNIDEKDNKKFFSNDFRSELESGVRKELCKIILVEDNPIILEKLAKLVKMEPKEERAALQKRLFRYLYEYRDGIPERMRRRMKNRTL